MALAVAQELVEEFEDGVWWVELAPISDPKLLVRAVAAVLDVPESQETSSTGDLVDYLRPRQTLLVLDNCEHLVEACADLVAMLLRACPDLVVLATSREPLRVTGESSWQVPSLSLPGSGRLAAAELADYEALRLFVERAQAVDAAFELTEENALVVARLCRDLDGIPLAIELAAARSRVLTAEQILEKLEDPLRFLTSRDRSAAPRQRTLRATLQWSYDLLAEAERALFRRLSVFVGGWDLEAAEAVGTGELVDADLVLDLLSALVNKSLALAETQTGGGLRHRMLEPVRQFAREKLRESGEATDLRRQHAEHYLALAETAGPQLLGPDQGLWLRRLRTEFPNLREAQAWSLEPGEEEDRARVRLRLPAALWRFWTGRRFQDGKLWLQTALERDPGGFPAVKARALDGLGYILLFQQDYDRAIAALEEAVALYKELGDRSGEAFALANFGYAMLHGGFMERVPVFVAEANTLMAQNLDDHARAYLSQILATAAILNGDLDSASAQFEAALALCRELGDLRNTSMALFNLGMITLAKGDPPGGAALLLEGTRITRELGDRVGGLYYVWAFGKLSAMQGRPLRAAKLWGAAETLRERMGMSLSYLDLTASGYELDLAAVRSELDTASFADAWAEGRTMSPEEAIEYALDEAVSAPPEDEPVRPQPPTAASPAPVGDLQATLHVFAFGRSRVEKDDLPLDSPDLIQKPRELLYYLLSHPEGRTKEQIGLALWPEASTAQLRSSFHDTVFRLRRALGAKEWVLFEKRRYAFGRELGYTYDVESFQENIAAARRMRGEAPEEAIGHLREARELYGGDFLEDVAPSEWMLERQEELRRAYGESLLLLGELLGSREHHAEAADAYRKAISHDRLLEEAHRGLMRSQVGLGEPGGALRHYEELARMLHEQLGSSPSSETIALYESLRSGE